MTTEDASAHDRELVLTRTIDVSPDKLFRCWTEADLVKQWWAPKPVTTPFVELDVRAGGVGRIDMRLPDGTDLPNIGVYLEVIPNRKLVLTDAYTSAWVPSQKPFMTIIVTFDELGDGKTLYTARVRHWTVADKEQHEKMGFHQGWAICAEQLAALVETR